MRKSILFLLVMFFVACDFLSEQLEAAPSDGPKLENGVTAEPRSVSYALSLTRLLHHGDLEYGPPLADLLCAVHTTVHH
jgi:hypothetical protein